MLMLLVQGPDPEKYWSIVRIIIQYKYMHHLHIIVTIICIFHSAKEKVPSSGILLLPCTVVYLLNPFVCEPIYRKS